MIVEQNLGIDVRVQDEEMADKLKTLLNGGGTTNLILVTAGSFDDYEATDADFTAATFTGYAPISVGTWAVGRDDDGDVIVYSSLLTWTAGATPGPETVVGVIAQLIGSNDLMGAAALLTPWPVNVEGEKMQGVWVFNVTDHTCSFNRTF